MPLKSMLHLNSNVLCSVTTQVIQNELIQISIIPLNSMLERSSNYLPFDMLMKPQTPEFMEIADVKDKNKLCLATERGIDPFDAADLFEDWFLKLKLYHQKNIFPLSYDWINQQPIIMRWLGQENYRQRFNINYRDILVVAQYLNDRADYYTETYPVPKVDFAYICAALKVERIHPIEPLTDCLAIAECYKRLVRR